VPINLDFKRGDQEVIRITHDLLKKYNYTGKVIWGSFEESVKAKWKAQDPSISRFASKKDVFKTCLLYYLGLLPYWKLDYESLQVPFPNDYFWSIRLSDTNKSFFDDPKKFKYVYKLMKYTLTPMLRHLDKRGIQTILWVINDHDNLDEITKFPIHGIMTDEPTKMIHKLRN